MADHDPAAADEALPCPFCGSAARVDACDRLISIGCAVCGYSRAFNGLLQTKESPVRVSLQEFYHQHAKRDAIDAWNRRAALAAPKAEAPARSVAVFAPPDDVALLKAYSRAFNGLQLAGRERAKFLVYARVGISADRARNAPTSPAPQEES